MNKRSLSIDRLIEILTESKLLTGEIPSACDFGPLFHVAIDSRSCIMGNRTLFAAIRTGVNDGHRYIPEMYRNGVRVFLCESIPEGRFPDACFIQVRSVRAALGAVASVLSSGTSEHRIVITGSYGKSAVKEVLYRALLDSNENVWRSPRSYNSYIGVAISAFEEYFSGNHGTSIYEVGIDGPGQAAALTDPSASGRALVCPEIGIITPVTEEHDENFASHKDKILEKIRLLNGCSRIVYDSTDSAVGQLLEEYFSERRNVELVKVSGNTGWPDTCRALAGAAIPGVDTSKIRLPQMRISIDHGVDDCVLMIDRFTPDLRSLQYALDRLHRHAAPGRPKVLILGKLLPEPGMDPETVRTAAKSLAADCGVDRVIIPDNTYGITEKPLSLRGCHILVFGEQTEFLKALVDSLQRADHDTSLEVDLDALIHNYDYYRHLLPTGTGIVAMVKASAYGMGAIEIGKTLQSRRASCLAVAVVDEGVSMRDAGINMPVMVLNPVTNRYQALFANNLEPAVFSADELERLISEARRAGRTGYPVHIKFDTGMHRVGFTEAQLDKLIDILTGQTAVHVESVFSHLATADCLDMDEYTKLQLDTFYRCCARLEIGLGHKFRRHILNTAGMMRFADCGPYEMARLGIGLYGISPLPDRNPNLRPVASLRSVVISVKEWPSGTPIGYGCKGRTHRQSIIATVPVGYADGIDRHLGNGAANFMVRGVACPTIGNICMDQCMIDATDVPDVTVGDRVEIFGPAVPVERLAETLGTIPYEILTSVSPRVHRTYFTK